MQFNSHATNQDIVSEIDSLCDSDSTSYPTAAKTRRVNAGLIELIGAILVQDGTFQYDDTNHTDLPRGTGTLVEGQSQYNFQSDYLVVEAIDIKTDDGLWKRIKQVDIADFDGKSPEEYYGTNSSGTIVSAFPKGYDTVGDTIFLYPPPTSTEVTLSGGIRVWFKRTADLFTTTDTTQEPGIPSPFHILLAYYAAIPYCMMYKKDRVAWLEKKWMEGKQALLDFEAVKRDKDKKPRMTPRYHDNR